METASEVHLPEESRSPTKNFYITDRMKGRLTEEKTRSRMDSRLSRNLSRASLKTPRRILKPKSPKVFNPEDDYDFDFDEEG